MYLTYSIFVYYMFGGRMKPLGSLKNSIEETRNKNSRGSNTVNRVLETVDPVEKNIIQGRTVYIATGQNKAGEKLYFGLQETTSDLNIKTYVKKTAQFCDSDSGLINYYNLSKRSETKEKWPEFKGTIAKSFTNQEAYKNFMQHLQDNKFYEKGVSNGIRAISSGSNHMFGTNAGFITFISKTPIDAPLSFKGMNQDTTLDAYLEMTKNTVMLIGAKPIIDHAVYVQGIHRTLQSMLEKGSYRGISMLLHSFNAAVFKLKGAEVYAVEPTREMGDILQHKIGDALPKPRAPIFSGTMNSGYDIPIGSMVELHCAGETPSKTDYPTQNSIHFGISESNEGDGLHAGALKFLTENKFLSDTLKLTNSEYLNKLLKAFISKYKFAMKNENYDEVRKNLLRYSSQLMPNFHVEKDQDSWEKCGEYFNYEVVLWFLDQAESRMKVEGVDMKDFDKGLLVNWDVKPMAFEYRASIFMSYFKEVTPLYPKFSKLLTKIIEDHKYQDRSLDRKLEILNEIIYPKISKDLFDIIKNPKLWKTLEAAL